MESRLCSWAGEGERRAFCCGMNGETVDLPLTLDMWRMSWKLTVLLWESMFESGREGWETWE